MAQDEGTSVPIRIELVPDPSPDPGASRIPGAIAGAAVAPGAVAAFLAGDDGEQSVYNDPAVLRAGDTGRAYTGVSAPGPEAHFPEPSGMEGPAGDGE
ncbi:hypothetical protein [Arthrobacter sp. Ld5]|uniref:hypothetical protein n=1 Tax=Arthrobacter sp. Ld5 TaxID=649152 RepID=UPI003EBA8CA0